MGNLKYVLFNSSYDIFFLLVVNGDFFFVKVYCVFLLKVKFVLIFCFIMVKLNIIIFKRELIIKK